MSCNRGQTTFIALALSEIVACPLLPKIILSIWGHMARKSMVCLQLWCLICEFSLMVRLLLSRLSNSAVNIM